MKRWVWILVLALFMTGCTGDSALLERAMALRANMVAREIRFDAEITADYGDKSYTFSMACNVDKEGKLSFSVSAPENIAGIKGTVSATGGKLTFEETALAFELMADQQLTPVSAPWILIRTLRGGYLTSCNEEGGLLRVAIDDSYEEDALHLDIWLDSSDVPQAAEIYWQGRRLLTIQVKNWVIG